ncbi:hypothetical protein SCA6_017500 [Theobroma cacao]
MVYIVPKDLQEIEVAKEKISGRDFLGARKMLLQVKRDFPAVDNISGMIAVCDILFSAALKFMDFDFYFVLQIPPEATSSEIKSKYNKFTALLEPILNNFPGAASALRIIQDAFSVLLHQEKRKMFDIKRARKLESCESRISNENNVMDSQLATEILIQRHENSRSSKRWRMGFYKAGDGYGNIYESNSMEIVSKIITDAKVSTYLGERQVHDSKLPTQSVICEGSIVGEQKKEIYDQEESWTACAMSSIGTMAGKPHDKFSPSMFLSDPSKKSSRLENCNQDYDTFDNTRNAALYSVGQIARQLVQPVPVTAHERKWYELKMPVVCGSFNLDRNERTVVEPTLLSHLISTHASEQIETYPQTDVVVKRLVKIQGPKSVFRRCTNNDSDHSFAIPAKSLYKFSHRIPAYRFADQEMDRVSDEMFELNHSAAPGVLDWDMTRGSRCQSTLTLNHATPLHKPSNAENSKDISWLQDNLPFASGLFRCGETTLNLDLARFSHTVKCEKIGEESLYRIYPEKGEFWALHKNRDGARKRADFKSHHQYQIVEIVKDFSEESGLIAVSLIEVPGRKSFFKRQLQNGHELCQTVTRKEMVRFSHQEPAYTVEGIELYGIPRGSWHLEPDALPPKLSTTVHLWNLDAR